MNSELMREITEDEVRRFHDDGVVFLEGMFDADWVEYIRQNAEKAIADPGELHHELAKEDDPGRFFTDTFVWHRHPEFRKFVFESPAAELVARVMESKKINIVFDQFLIKEPGTRERTVWHHDLTYWPIRGNQVCTLWLALDEVTPESGAMELVKGSHKWGKRFKPVAFVDPERYKTEEEPVPDIDAMRDELDIVQFHYKPGDCTIHHGLLVHGAPGNSRTDRRRRAYVTRWAGDDVVYDPRPNIQPMLWEPQLRKGEPLDSDLWPKVRERAA